MIPDVPPFNNYSGNNYVTKFDYDLSIDDETQLVVLHTNSSGIQKELKLNVDFSIHGVGDENGGYIIFPLTGSNYGLLQEDEVISLYLSLPVEQQTPFGTSDKLDMNILEKTFDYVVKLIKIISRQVERSVKIQEGSKISPAELIESLKTSEINAVKSALNAGLSEQNAKQSADIASQKANEVSQTYANAMSDITSTTRESLDDIETARLAGVKSVAGAETQAIQNIQSLNTTTLNGINNAKSEALEEIETSKSEALDNISKDLSNAKNEMLETKTDIIDNLINNAAGEALTAIEDVKTSAVSTINTSVDSAKNELNTLINSAHEEADSHIKTVEGRVNTIVENAQNTINEGVEAVNNIKIDVENKADEANTSALLAKKYAENPVDVEVINGEYSAKHWAYKAEQTAEAVGNPLDKNVANITETGKQKIVEIVEDAGISGGSSYPMFTINSNCSVTSTGNPDMIIPNGERRYMALVNTYGAEVTSSDGTTFDLSNIPSYSYVRPQAGSLMITVVFPINLTDNSHDKEENYSILLVSEDGNKWTLETANFIISPVFPGTVGEGIAYDHETLEEIIVQGDFEHPYYWIDTSSFPYKTYYISEYNDKINPTAKPRYVIPMYDLHRDKQYPRNFDWFSNKVNNDLSDITNAGEEKIKNLIANVGMEPARYPFAVNAYSVRADNSYDADSYIVLQGMDLPAPSNPSGGTSGGYNTILQDIYFNGDSIFTDLQGNTFIFDKQRYSEYSYSISGLFEDAQKYFTDSEPNEAQIVLFINKNVAQEQTYPDSYTNRRFKFGMIIVSETEYPFINPGDVDRGTNGYVRIGDASECVFWLKPSTNTLHSVKKTMDAAYNTSYSWQEATQSDYIPLCIIEKDETSSTYIGSVPIKYTPIELNKNWFNNPEPAPYLKANLDNLTETGRMAIKSIVEEILQA